MRETMTEAGRVLAMNRAGWDRLAPRFYGATALPEYGPLAPTEDSLSLLDLTAEWRALELGCGSGHSLRYLAQRGVRELWGVDLSPVQIAFARETLQPVASRCRLFESPMEVNPGIPTNYFDLVFSIWGMGWTTDLRATLALVAEYLRPGGCFLVSGEHPAFGRLEWNGTHYIISKPVLRRRRARARLVEGRADRHPASDARHLGDGDASRRASGRGADRRRVQREPGGRHARRSGTVVLGRTSSCHADDVRPQSAETESLDRVGGRGEGKRCQLERRHHEL